MKPYSWPAGKHAAVMISIDVDADTPLLWRTRNELDLRFIAELEQRQHGLRHGLKALQAVLERHKTAATFFVPALVAERMPALLPGLVAAGHEVGLHGYAHETVRETTDGEFTVALERSILIFEQQTGRVPRGFRAPGWEMTEHMLKEIERFGLYDSSLAGLDWPYTLGQITEIPISWAREDTARFKLTGLADRWPPTGPDQVLAEWIFDYEATAAAGGLFVLTLHDWIAGRPAQLRVLDTLLARIQADEATWITTGTAIADHHRTLDISSFPVPMR
jgi:peptidoglycan-N-acetylglucosamine deacetylase